MTITFRMRCARNWNARRRRGGFASVDEYFIWLSKSDLSDTNDLTLEDLGYASQKELEAKLIAALDSGPPVLVTPEFWNDLRKEVVRPYPLQTASTCSTSFAGAATLRASSPMTDRSTPPGSSQSPP